MSNRYEDLLNEQEQSGPVDRYEQLLDQQDATREGALADTLRQARQTTPDARAEALKLADQYQVPVDLIERNLEAFRTKAAAEPAHYEQLLERAPKLADWITRQPEAAAAAQDDLEQLQALEHTLSFGASILRGVDTAQGMFGGFVEASGELLGADTLTAYGRGVREHNDAQAIALGRRTSIAALRGPWDLAQWAKETIGEQIPIMAPMLAGGATGAAIGSVVPVIGTTIGATIGAFLPAFAMGVGEVQGSIKEINPEASAPAAAFIGGSAIAALDSVLPGKIGARLARSFGLDTAEAVARRALLQPVHPKYLRQTAREMATEGLTEALQEAIGAVAAAAGTETSVDWSALSTQMLEAGAAGALVGGVSSGVSSVVERRGINARIAAAEQSKAVFDALAQGVTDSKLYQRLPGKAQEFIAQATKGGPLETVFAPLDTWTTYWQSKQIDPALMAAEVTGRPDAYEQAQKTGEDLAIPTAVYATKIAATEHHTFFAQELRLGDAGRLNAREAAALKADVETQAKAAAADTTTPAAGPVREAVLAQLAAAGVEPSVAEHYATLYESAFGTLGQRAGVDPVELFARYGLQVTREGLPGGLADTGAQTRSNAFAGESAAVPDIPASAAQPGESPDQRRVRRQAHLAALTPGLVRDAQAVDPNVDPAFIASELEVRLSMLEEEQQATRESGRGQDLLRAIAGYGGLWFHADSGAHQTEIERLREGRDIAGMKAGTGRIIHNKGRATWNGVPGVFREDGLTPDAMVRSLMQDPRFNYLEDDLNLLLDAVDEALRAEPDVDALPGTAELRARGVKPGTAWWARNQGAQVEADTADTGADEVDETTPEDGGDGAWEFTQPLHAWQAFLVERLNQEPEQLVDDDGRSLLGPGGYSGAPVAGLPVGPNDQVLLERHTAIREGRQAVAEGRAFSLPSASKPRGGDTELFQAGVEIPPPIVDSNGKQVATTPEATAAFVQWFGESKALNAAGQPLVVYHGTGRLDRMGPSIRKGRATSGPMPFFTNDRTVASRYAEQKADTSLAREDGRYEAWFRLKVKGSRAAINVDRAWWFLTPEERARIAELAPRVTEADGRIVLAPAGHTDGMGGYDQHIVEARGNHLAALVEEWLNSANLFNAEKEFLQVLELAGVPADRIVMHDPTARFEGVLPVYLAITNPLDTSNVSDDVVALLERRAKSMRRRPTAPAGAADAWDKSQRDPREWVEQLKTDRANGVNSFVWTSIPDFVTEELRALGYDGIHDTGGKTGGVEHDVWIPFTPGQVKSAIGNRGTFEGKSPNILYQSAYHGSPHLFDKFETKAIGSGEGAQVYGWGLYFSSKREIAEWYQRNLAGKPKDKGLALDGVRVYDDGGILDWLHEARQNGFGVRAAELREFFKGADLDQLANGLPELWSRGHWLQPGTPLEKLREELTRTIDNLSRAHAEGRPLIATNGELSKAMDLVLEGVRLTEAKAALYTLEFFGDRLSILPEEKAGRLYTVDIPDHDTYLDWDKSIAEQPALVRAALEAANVGATSPIFERSKAFLIGQLREVVEANGGDPNELETLVSEMLASRNARIDTDESQANWERLFNLVEGPERPFTGRNPVNLNRIHDVANYGVDQTYIDHLIDQKIDEIVANKFDELTDNGLLENPVRVFVRTSDDPDFPYDVVDGDEVVDAYSELDEAEAAAAELETHHTATWERDTLQDFRSNVNRDRIESGIREDLGLHAGWGLLGAAQANTGEGLYDRLAEQHGGPAEASKFLASIGVNGIQYLDGTSRSRGTGSYNYVVFDDRLVSIVEYEQRQEDAKRGVIRFGPDRQFKIELLRRADLSTFLHESGHFFLEVFGDLVEQVSGQPLETLSNEQRQMLADYGAILQALGVEDRKQIGVEQHEQFARLFEAYLMTGEAPSAELRSAFARFRAWLVGVYRSLRALNVELSDEIRGAFDRMLATDAALEAARTEAQVAQVFTDATSAGMTELEFASYLDQVREASTREQEELQARVLSELKRGELEWWRQERDAFRADVTAEVHARPVYRAMSVIRTGRYPDGAPFHDGDEAPAPIKLSRASIVAQYGKDLLTRLPRPYLYAVDTGIAPDTAAAMFGFSSGDEMLKAFLEARPMKDVIEEEVEARMFAKHGDVFRDGRLQDEARKIVAGEHRQRVIHAELRALTRGLVRTTIPSADVINQEAVDRINATRIRDIRPGTFLQASRRAARQAFELLAGGSDRAGAVRAKLQELVNLALYREARDAKDRVESMRRTLQAYGSAAARKRFGKAGADYLDQIDGILERYELARVSQGDLDRRESLRAFVERQEAAGLPFDIPKSLLDDARRLNYQDLTYDELVAIYDTVEQIAHLARLKNKLLKSKADADLDLVVLDLGVSIRERTSRRRTKTIETRLPDERVKRQLEGLFASHRKIASLARELDGFEDGGLMWEHVILPINEAGDREAAMNLDATQRLGRIFTSAYSGKDLIALYQKRHIPAIDTSLTKMGRLMVALNWGNEGNRDRIRTGYGWTDAQVQAVLETLDDRDWTFVQSVWTYIDSYWEEIAAKQKRVIGVAPEKVPASPFQVRVGGRERREFSGGYFPLKYDDRQTGRAMQNVDVDEAGLQRTAAYVKATTRRGHTEARQESIGDQYRVRLDFGVITEHVQQVVHDLSHHEMLIDLGRVLGHKELQAAVFETHGDIVYRQFKEAAKDIAFGAVPATSFFEQSMNHVRSGATVAGLGWNLTTAFLQPLGLTQSIARIGPKWVGKGLSRWLRDAAHLENSATWITDKSTFMRLRAQTQQREINEIRNQIGLNTGKFVSWIDAALPTIRDVRTRQHVVDSFFWFIQVMQRVADIPTWLGAYEKAMAAGEPEERAIALADQAVLDSQGGGQVKDMAGVQRGGPLLKLWTNFYSFFNTTYNLAAETKRRTQQRRGAADVGRAGVDYLLLFIVPATLGFYMREAMKGELGDGEDEGLWALLGENAAYLMGTMLGVRELAGVVQGYAGWDGPSGARVFANLSRLGTQATQGEADEAFWKALNDAGGAVLRYPSGQVRRTVAGAAALSEGTTANPLVLVTGPPQ